MTGAASPSELTDRVGIARLRGAARVVVTIAAVLVLTAIGLAAGSVAAPTGLRWVTGIILVLLLAFAWLLCAHAGGHALLVPLPALVLAVVWAVTAPGLHGGAGWWLVAMSAAAAGLGTILGASALRHQHAGSLAPPPSLRGTSGRALTPLTPQGVVQVGGESWSAVSLSGPLPAGAEVHVAGIDGVRLAVWSDAGVVPDERTLGYEEEQQ
jgi:membrane protein implicated in regulation of membrane protease activity